MMKIRKKTKAQKVKEIRITKTRTKIESNVDVTFGDNTVQQWFKEYSQNMKKTLNETGAE